MAYDEELADRIRELIAGEPGVTEQRMFGGLAFLIGGNMAVAASGQGGALVRVEPAQSDKLVATTPVTSADLAPLTQQVNQARSNLAQEWTQVVMEIRGILKPEQLAKAAQNRQRLNQLREEMRTVLGGPDTP